MQYGYAESLRDGLCPQTFIQIFSIEKEDLFNEVGISLVHVCHNEEVSPTGIPEGVESIQLRGSLKERTEAAAKAAAVNNTPTLFHTFSYQDHKLGASLSDAVFFADQNPDIIELSLGRRVFISSTDEKNLSAIISFLKGAGDCLYNSALETQECITLGEYRYHFDRYLDTKAKIPKGLTGKKVDDLKGNFVVCSEGIEGCCVPCGAGGADDAEYTYVYVDNDYEVIDVIGVGTLPISFQKPRKLFCANEETISFLKKFTHSKTKNGTFDIEGMMLDRLKGLVATPKAAPVATPKAAPKAAPVAEPKAAPVAAPVAAPKISTSARASINKLVSYFNDEKKEGLVHLIALQNGDDNVILYKSVNDMLSLINKDWPDEKPSALKEIFNTCDDDHFAKIDLYL